MSHTATEIRERAIEIMATNCMVCKKHDCAHSSNDKPREEWIQNSYEYFIDEHFSCFIDYEKE
jgi:hypothetical protein